MPERRPNILLIHVHDLGRFLGCYGVPTVHTPNLDRLAADGILFNQAFCVAPQCSPSRASLFTGRYPQSHGVLGLTQGDFGWDLDPDERHIATELRGAGYHTALVGVHHESRSGDNEQVARRLGFDHASIGGVASVVTEKAISQLRQMASADGPFYLQVGYFEPHRLRKADEADYVGFLGDYIQPDTEYGVTVPPYLVDDELARQELAELQGAVRHMDTAVGRLLDALVTLGLDDDTITVFTTDHGLALPRAKCSLYDPGLEVALLLRYPRRKWTGGIVDNTMHSNIDIAPTLLQAANVPAPKAMQGQSITPFIAGGTQPGRDHIFGQLTYHRYYDPARCIRTRTHKLIANFSSAPIFMDPTQSWRPRTMAKVETQDTRTHHPPVELYDLVEDPDETRNLSDHPDYKDAAKHLAPQLLQWMEELADPLLDGGTPCPLFNKAMRHLNHLT